MLASCCECNSILTRVTGDGLPVEIEQRNLIYENGTFCATDEPTIQYCKDKASGMEISKFDLGLDNVYYRVCTFSRKTGTLPM